MEKSSIKLITAALAAAVVVLLLCFVVQGPAESDEPAIELSVDSDGPDKLIRITSSSDVFKDTMAGEHILAYYVPLDAYVEGTFFDYDSFAADLEAEGVWDEDIQDYIPSNTEKVDAPYLELAGPREATVSFQAEGRYAAYIVLLSPEALIGIHEPYVAMKIDVPEFVYAQESPAAKIVSEVYENMTGQTIIISLENTVFTDVGVEDIRLMGSFSPLEVTYVTMTSPDTVEIGTSGYVSMGTSGMGMVELSDTCTESGVKLSCQCWIREHSISLVPSSFQLKGGILAFDIKVSDGILEELDWVSVGEHVYDIGPSDISVSGESNFVKIRCDVGTDDIGRALDMLDGLFIVPFDYDGNIINGLGFPLVVPQVICDAYVEGIEMTDDGCEASIFISASYGSMADGLTPSHFTIDGAFDRVSDLRVEQVDGGYLLDVVLEGLYGPYLAMVIEIEGGAVSLWGETCDAVAYVYHETVSAPNDKVSADEMIDALYKNMKFNKVFSGIGYAVKGVGIIVDILGATGVIDMRSATDIAIAEINVKCDEIKKMLADQAVTLERMNQKLDQIIDMLKEERLTNLSMIYSTYRSASNDLSSAIYAYSSAIKSDIWEFVRGDHDGKTFFIYFSADDGKATVVPGDFFTKHSTGVTLDGKAFIPEATIGITVEKDVTFQEARSDVKFGGETEKHMVNDLARYVREHILKDGQTTYDVKSGNVSKSYTAEQLAQAIYDCMVIKCTEMEANDDPGEEVLRNYYRYTETMASLVVNPDGSITVNFDLRSNPVLAATEIMQSNYNFEKEAHDNLKALNDSFTIFLYNYTLLAQSIEKLNAGSSGNVEKHFDASMKFLSEHRGYNTSKEYNPHTFCYVTGTNLRSDIRIITAQATYHSKDGFDHAVDDQPHNISFNVKDFYTGQVDGKAMISDQQLMKLLSNYKRLYPKDTRSFTQYIGDSVEGERFLYDRLVIQWDGVRTYDDGYHVKLFSKLNLVNPGHSAQLMDSGSIYEISGTMDKSGFLNQFKAYSNEVYGKYYVAGKAYSMGSCSYVGKTCNCDNCLFAIGFFCKHVSAWTNDESALLTCEKDVPNTGFITERNGNDWTVGSETKYTVLLPI